MATIFPDDIKISLKFVPMGPIFIFLALIQIMAWRRPGDKPLSEPIMISLLAHIWVIRPQWVNMYIYIYIYIGNPSNKYNNIVDNCDNDAGYNDDEEGEQVEGRGWEGVMIKY